jgi:hypothetical protein
MAQYSTVCAINTQLAIPASPEAVWDVLADFTTWGDWNDFMVLPVPPKAVGRHCRVLFRLDEGCLKTSTHDPEVNICILMLMRAALCRIMPMRVLAGTARQRCSARQRGCGRNKRE